jgi:hypothetical protein
MEIGPYSGWLKLKQKFNIGCTGVHLHQIDKE